MIYATAEPEDVQKAQDQLGRPSRGDDRKRHGTIGETAFDLGYRRFVVAGGETSGAVAQALGITSVIIGPEITPGVPWVYAEKQDQPFQLALKSGNFGQEDFFTDALMP